MSKYLNLEHGSSADFSFPMVSSGKSGTGFYAYSNRSHSMRNFYNQGHIYSFRVLSSHIVDLTTTNNYIHAKAYIENILGKKITKSIFQQSGILLSSYVQKFHPNAKGYINFHFGYGLPNSKEVIIFDTSVIEDFHKKG